MARSAVKLFAMTLLLVHAAMGLGQEAIKYEISFPNYLHHEGEVRVTFPELTNSKLELRMSRTSPGRYALHEFAKNVYNVRATDGAGRALEITRPNPHQWDVAGHDGTVKVSYTIFGDRSDGTYLAIDNTHAHMNMPATFMWAKGLQDRPIEIVCKRPNPEWQIATQLVPTDDPQKFTAPNLAYFMDSPTEISAFQLREWELNGNGAGNTIRLALHHDGAEAEADVFAEMCQAVVAEQIALFRAPPRFDYGTYTFIADYLPHVNGDGMEHRNSTILSSTRALAQHSVRNLGTVSHEFFHAWNVERMRPRSLEPFDFEEANMSAELWFAEGFTSYYDGLFIKRAQLISLDRFAQDVSRTLNFVKNAPGRQFFNVVEMSQQAPFVDAARSVDPRNFDNTFVSYYSYGAAIGLGLDLTLRERFQNITLDDFMRAVWKKHGVTEAPYTNEDLRQILGEVTGDRAFADGFFEKHILGRELVDYKTLLRQAGLLLRQAKRDSVWMGEPSFKFAGETMILTSPTTIGSPLYEAGLDRGDRILEIDGQTITNKEALAELLAHYQPGDSAEIHCNQNGVERTASLVFKENPALEVVPFEHVGLEVTQKGHAFRESWFGSKAGGHSIDLKKHCHKCSRSFAFQNEFCRFDGEALRITPRED